jgi:hypothetical protein
VRGRLRARLARLEQAREDCRGVVCAIWFGDKLDSLSVTPGGSLDPTPEELERARTAYPEDEWRWVHLRFVVVDRPEAEQREAEQ